MNKDTGIVVIGRNEGGRLKRCLHNILYHVDKVVYVDSGSSDDSVNFAKSLGVDVVQLDMSTPFTASRARNSGFNHLTCKYQYHKYIQFIDGDCELCEGWVAHAAEFFEAYPSYAIVTGGIKERFPEKSIYNLLCDIEWNRPSGESKSCGGIFMIRKNAFLEIGGFNLSVSAGEEPELCYRLQQHGWKIYRLDYLMAIHDAAITHFSQWWRRAVRSGHAYAQGYALHGTDGKGYCIRDSLRIWFWSFILPGFILSFAFFDNPFWGLLFMIYPILLLKIAVETNKRIGNWNCSFAYALFNLIGKWAQLLGQMFFIIKKLATNVRRDSL